MSFEFSVNFPEPLGFPLPFSSSCHLLGSVIFTPMHTCVHVLTMSCQYHIMPSKYPFGNIPSPAHSEIPLLVVSRRIEICWSF